MNKLLSLLFNLDVKYLRVEAGPSIKGVVQILIDMNGQTLYAYHLVLARVCKVLLLSFQERKFNFDSFDSYTMFGRETV